MQAGDVHIHRATADAQWENAAGLGLYGAFHGNQTDAGEAGDGFDWGAIAQLGYLINKKTELFARYDLLHLDNTAPATKTRSTSSRSARTISSAPTARTCTARS